MNWNGVFPAITTAFRENGSVDLDFVAKHASWMVEEGCKGVVALGSLGEGATLEDGEKLAVLETIVGAVGNRVPVVAGISALSTAQAVRLARDSERIGCQGLMVLPAYVYKGDWREQRSHFEAVFAATGLSCMLYNNPIAYVVDVTPDQLAELAARNENLHSVKESSADVRRVTAIRQLLGDRMAIFVGVNDLIVEGIAAGAVGWIAGLVNACPRESVRLFELATNSDRDAADTLYKWFLPLLKLDVVPSFVQLIKLAQQEAGMGSERVRAPRLQLVGEERESALVVIKTCLATNPLKLTEAR